MDQNFCSSEAPLCLFFCSGETFFFFRVYLKTTDNQIKPAETNNKTEEREKVNTEEEEEFERTRKNKYKRE